MANSMLFTLLVLVIFKLNPLEAVSQDAFRAVTACYLKEINGELIENVMKFKDITPLSLANLSISFTEADSKLAILDKVCVAFNRSLQCAGGRWWEDSANAQTACDLIRCLMGSALGMRAGLSPSATNANALSACSSADRLQNLLSFMAWGCTAPDAKLTFLREHLLLFTVTFRQAKTKNSIMRLVNVINNNYAMNDAVCVTLRADIHTVADAIRTSGDASAGDSATFFIKLMQIYLLNTVTGRNASACPIETPLPNDLMVPWRYLVMDPIRTSFPVVGTSLSSSCDNSAVMMVQAAEYATFWYQNYWPKDDGEANNVVPSTRGVTTTKRMTYLVPQTVGNYGPMVVPTVVSIDASTNAVLAPGQQTTAPNEATIPRPKTIAIYIALIIMAVLNGAI